MSLLLDRNNNLTNTKAGGIEKTSKRWDFPWGSTVVDVVAPAFGLILENYIIDSGCPKKRKKLELCLAKLLRYTFHAEVMHIVNILIVAQFWTTAYFCFKKKCVVLLLYIETLKTPGWVPGGICFWESLQIVNCMSWLKS